jgi:hypothetical protein
MKKANVYARGTAEQTHGRTRHLWFEHKCGVRRVPKERCSLMSQFAQLGQPRHVLRAPTDLKKPPPAIKRFQSELVSTSPLVKERWPRWQLNQLQRT